MPRAITANLHGLSYLTRRYRPPVDDCLSACRLPWPVGCDRASSRSLTSKRPGNSYSQRDLSR